jgi:quercetin dioxygenase-like cupin family protein
MNKLIVGFGLGAVLGLSLGGVLSTSVASAAAGAAMAQGGDAGGNVRVVLENARVRVREVTFPPKQTSAMHTHALAHVGIVIQGGTLSFRYPDGKTETEKLTAGGVGYRDANVTHEPTNVGAAPVRVIEVELK